MLVRLVDGVRRRNLHVTVHDPHATVAALLAAVAPGRPAATVRVDGRTVRAGQPLDRAGIGDGAEVVLIAGTDPPDGNDPSRPDRPVADLAVVDGLDCGRRFGLAPAATCSAETTADPTERPRRWASPIPPSHATTSRWWWLPTPPSPWPTPVPPTAPPSTAR